MRSPAQRALLDKNSASLSLRFDIEDTGTGIKPDQLERIFNAFEQEDSSTTRHHGGTGLGLTISRQLVTWMGGEIVCDSTPSVGSRFQVRLNFPYAVSTSTDTTSDSQVTDGLPDFGAHVLLVEDNPVNQEVALCMLEALGCHVGVASEGRDALDSANRNEYDLIFMVCHMPGMDGFSATREIRRLE